MPITSWIRDLFGIQKDMYETKKTRLEIEKIEDEKREKLITSATLEDVKEYDPKTKELLSKIEERPGGRISREEIREERHRRRRNLVFVLMVITLLVLG